MTNGEVAGLVSSAAMKYEDSLKRNMGVKANKETLKNVLFNCYPELVKVISDNVDKVDSAEVVELNNKVAYLEGTVAELNKSLEDADKEYNALRKEFNALKKKLKASSDESNGG